MIPRFTTAAPSPATSEPAAELRRFVGWQGDRMLVAPLGGPGEAEPVLVALPPGEAPSDSDQVVVLPTKHGAVVVACVGRKDGARSLADGTQVACDGRSVTVTTRDGATLFRYEASRGEGRVTLSHQSMTVESGHDLRLRARGALTLEGRDVRVGGQDIALEGRRLSVSVEESKAQMRSAKVHVDRLETVAGVVVQTARSLYQRVHELAQLRAGRMRTLVDGTLQSSARNLLVRAEEAFKVRGDKIDLG